MEQKTITVSSLARLGFSEAQKAKGDFFNRLEIASQTAISAKVNKEKPERDIKTPEIVFLNPFAADDAKPVCMALLLVQIPKPLCGQNS